jgi:hypothetical protein
MPLFTVMFQTDAATLEEAEAVVGEWTVTPNTMLVSIVGSVSSEGMPVTIPDGGRVAEGTPYAPEQPPPPPPPPEVEPEDG